MDVNDAFIEIAEDDEYMFQNVDKNDIVVYQTNSNHALHIGAVIDARANLVLTPTTTTVYGNTSISLNVGNSNVLSVGTETVTAKNMQATSKLFLGTASNDGFSQPSIGNVTVFTDNVERIRVDAQGNLGVGITTPTEKLHVDGSVRAVSFKEGSSTLSALYAGSNVTNTRLNTISDVANWSSNLLASTTSTTNSNATDISSITSVAAWGSNTSSWLSNALPSYANSNSVYTKVNWTSNTLSNFVKESDLTPNLLYLSNTSTWASNEIAARPTLAVVDLLYAKSNETFYSIQSTSVVAEAARSNAIWSSNTSWYASNQLPLYVLTTSANQTFAQQSALAIVDATATMASNAATFASNATGPTSNMALYASNTGWYASNALPSYLTSATASNIYALSNAQSNWVFASNTAVQASNAAFFASNDLPSRMKTTDAIAAFAGADGKSNWNYGSNTALYASNVAAWASNTIPTLTTVSGVGATFALSNGQSNWNYASNTSRWASNNASSLLSISTAADQYARSNGQSNWDFASNTVVRTSNTLDWASNALATTCAASNGQSNWVYASNTASALATSLPTYTLSSAADAKYARLTSQSNWDFASNAAMFASNLVVPTSNAGFWASNALKDVVRSTSTGDWNYASNTSFWASNQAQQAVVIAVWGSNTAAGAAPAAGQSNWNYASNTGVWNSNSMSNHLQLSTASNMYAPSNAQSNWDFASNAATWASNYASNALLKVDAAALYGRSNGQSNWVFASNAAFWSSNVIQSYAKTADVQASYALISSLALYAPLDSVNQQLAENVARATFGSNTAYDASNVARWGSNTVTYASNNTVWTSNRAVWASNVALYASNSTTWASNAALYASNTVMWASNNFTLYIKTTQAMSSNANVYASNTAYWTSNNLTIKTDGISNQINTLSNVAYYASNITTTNSAAGIYSCNQLQNYLRLTDANGLFLGGGEASTITWTSNTASWGSNTATWASNAFQGDRSNWVFASNTASWGSNAHSNNIITYALSNGQSNWAFASNTALWGSNAHSNTITTYALSNGQSNWVFASNTVVAASNTAYWTSNALPGYLVSTTAANTYALSNGQSNWVFASNTSLAGSNTAYWTSNGLSNYLVSTAAANTYALSNGQSNWVFASNTSLAGSNAAYWTSNALPAYLVSTTAANTYALSNGQSNWVFASNTSLAGSNTAYWTSNALPNYLVSTTAANTYALSNGQSNWIFSSNTSTAASNTAYWTSNTLSNTLAAATASSMYALSNGQSNWVFASNTIVPTSNAAYWTSNAMSNILVATIASSTYALSNGQSNWVFASNTIVPTSNAAYWTSNVLSNYITSTTSAITYARSNGQSNWNWGSNTAFWGSNAHSNYLLTSAASSYLLESSAASTYALSNGQSNWNWGSNTAFWGSNAHSNYLLTSAASSYLLATTASSTYALSNGQSNWNWGSNTAFWGSNAHSNYLTTTNAASTYLTTTTATSTYAQSNGQSNWNWGSNTAFWGSNAHSNYLQTSTAASTYLSITLAASTYLTTAAAANTYALSNGQSNWNWASNNTGGRYWTSSSSNVTTSSNVGIGTTTPDYPLDVNGVTQIAPTTNTQTPLRVLNSTQNNNNTMGVLFGKALTNYNSAWVNFQHLGTDASPSNYMSLGLWGIAVTSAPLTLNGYGRVGISTNTPAYNLDVIGTCGISSNLFFGSTTRQMINLHGTQYAIGVQGSTTYLRSGADFQFYKGGVHSDTQADPGLAGTAVMTIKSSGNVGINNSNPLYDLHVSGDAALYNGGNSAEAGGTLNFGCAFNLAAGPMASITGRLANWASNATYNTLSGGLAFLTRPSNLSANTSLVEAMRVSDVGYLGIGTTTPDYPLDVNGVCRVSGEILVTTAQVLRSVYGSYGFFLRNDGVAVYLMSTNINDQYGGWNSYRPFQFNLNSGLTILGGNLNVLASGNVGIGTASPAYNLDVVGTCRVSSNMFFGSTGRQMLNLFGTQYAIGVQGATTYFRTGGDFQFYLNGVHSDTQADPGSGGSALMTIKSSGNVGIGWSSPSYKLDVNGGIKAGYFLETGYGTISEQGTHVQWSRAGDGMSCWINQQGSGSGGHAWGQSTTANVFTECMRLTAGGRLGIGTASPSYPLHVSGIVNASTLTGQYIFGSTSGLITGTAYNVGVSIYASGAIASAMLFSISDQRVKNCIVDIDGQDALSTIMQLQPKQFGYVDKIQYGSKSTYGFIAQHVESIANLSNVVRSTTEIVPNVYDKAVVTDDIITLHSISTACLLDGNIHLQVYTAEGAQADVDILEILDDQRIRIDKCLGDGVVFVYGQRVDDFKIVDKEAIFTLGIAAIKTLNHTIRAQQTVIESLLKRVALLEKYL